MRDRLIKLILNTPVLKFPSGSRAQGKTYQTAQNLADHLLANGVVVLPCKIGDTVYIIDEGDGECAADYVLGVEVTQLFINNHGIALDLQLPLGLRLNTWAVIGKNVFLTKEEAEKALAERSGE